MKYEFKTRIASVRGIYTVIRRTVLGTGKGRGLTREEMMRINDAVTKVNQRLYEAFNKALGGELYEKDGEPGVVVRVSGIVDVSKNEISDVRVRFWVAPWVPVEVATRLEEALKEIGCY